jgi:hypothetical protein
LQVFLFGVSISSKKPFAGLINRIFTNYDQLLKLFLQEGHNMLLINTHLSVFGIKIRYRFGSLIMLLKDFLLSKQKKMLMICSSSLINISFMN